MTPKRLIILFMTIVLMSCSRFVDLNEENYTKLLSDNLIENGDFETYQDNIDTALPGWILDKVSVDKVAIDTTRSFSGHNSLKLTQPSREIQLVSEPFSTNHRNIYGIRLAAKSVLKKTPIVVHFMTFSENGKIVSKYYKTIIVDTKWKTFSFVADFLKVNSEFGRVFITIPKNDSVLLLDDISCHIIDSRQKK